MGYAVMKPKKAVIILQGRYAGRKAAIVSCFDDGTPDRPYGHCLVAGIDKYPRKIIRKDFGIKGSRKTVIKCFMKVVNYKHILPTRYTVDVDLKDVVDMDAYSSRFNKLTALFRARERFEKRLRTGKNRWFFAKLRFGGIGGLWISVLLANNSICWNNYD